VHQEQTAPLVTQPPRNAQDAVHELGDQLKGIAERKIWLPEFLYESLPMIYILIGVVALLSTLFNRHWSWLVPHLFLLGCLLIHLGLMFRRIRARSRARSTPTPG
jgi:hypothetical protein